MNIVDMRVKIVQSLEKHIERELRELSIPVKYMENEKIIIAGREDTFGIEANIAGNEEPTFRNLYVNVALRVREFRQAMGMVLLYSNIGPVDPYQKLVAEGKNELEYSEHFWTSYGDFQIRSCSLLDSIGSYLAFVFFGIVDAPFYFNQVVEALKLKHTDSSKRKVLDGEPYKLTGRESWEIIIEAKERYQNKLKRWRDEIVHAFSPLMFARIDGDYIDEERRQILRNPALDAGKALEECKNTYFLLKLVPLAADDLAVSFIGTGSYHRNYYQT